MSIPFIISSDFITVINGNAPTTIYSNDNRFSKLKELIKNREWDKVGNLCSLPKTIAKFSFGKVQVFDGAVTFEGKELNNTLTSRILEFCREGFPFEPLARFMNKLMENPSERSREQVYRFMEVNKLPITEDGDVIFFKVVTKDFKDRHTQKIDNSIGQIVKMDRNLVDDDPSSTCSSGLHCASWSYCKTFGSAEDIVLLVKVNPKNIVSVPVDHNASKVRVCEYEVIKVVGEKDKVIDFSSNLAERNEVIETNNNSDVPIVTKVIDSKKIIGQNPAYVAHKKGLTVFSATLGTINPQPPRARSFFRTAKDWSI
jgi:hypothetical protein